MFLKISCHPCGTILSLMVEHKMYMQEHALLM